MALWGGHCHGFCGVNGQPSYQQTVLQAPANAVEQTWCASAPVNPGQTLNRELGTVFRQWYPDIQVEELAEAA
jgi:hypothetical protein